MTQTERILKAARSYKGVCRIDFQLPDVIDGGDPILNFPGRMWDLEHEGHSFEVIGRRNRCKVFRLVDVEAALSRPVASPPGPVQCAGGGLSTDSLFGVPRVAGTPHWKEAA